MRHRLAALVVSLLLAGPAQAQTQTQTQTQTQQELAPRAGKRVSLGVEPIGFPVVLPAVGATVGFYLRPDLALELNHARSGLGLYVVSVWTRITVVRMKKFFGDSFYVNAGLGQRTVGGRFTLEDVAVTELDAETEITSLVGDLAIGNQWQLGRFALGVDWLGWMPHLRVLRSHDTYPYQQASEAEKDRKSRFEALASRGNPQFLRLYVGMAF